MSSITLDQAWRIRAAVGRVATLDRRQQAGENRRSEIAIAARQASNETAIAQLAAAAQPSGSAPQPKGS